MTRAIVHSQVKWEPRPAGQYGTLSLIENDLSLQFKPNHMFNILL